MPKVEVAVLHELVHWADHQANGEATPVDRDVYHDVGSKWEWLVFGVALPEMQRD